MWDMDELAEKYGALCDYLFQNFLTDGEWNDGLLHTSDEARRHATAIFDLLELHELTH